MCYRIEHDDSFQSFCLPRVTTLFEFVLKTQDFICSEKITAKSQKWNKMALKKYHILLLLGEIQHESSY